MGSDGLVCRLPKDPEKKGVFWIGSVLKAALKVVDHLSETKW